MIRAEVGWPPLAAPIGQVLASQALLNVLSASRYLTIVDELRALVIGRFGTPPGPIDPAVKRAVALTHDPETQEDVAPALSEVREQAEGMAASEEELLLLGLFGEDAERLLLGIRGRASGETDELASVDKARAERIRELVRIVQESGIGEVTIEEDGMRVSVRSNPEAPVDVSAQAPLALPDDVPAAIPPAANGVVRVESPMVGDLLPRGPAGRAAVRRGGRRRRRRPDAVHPRGDEAHERGEGRCRGGREANSRRERPGRSSSGSCCSTSIRSSAGPSTRASACFPAYS